MSLKDNFNQAVKDFLKKDGMVGDDPFKGSVNTGRHLPQPEQLRNFIFGQPACRRKQLQAGPFC